MFTPDRDRAKVIGLAVHLINGWIFAIVYGLFFENIHAATWWYGALLGGLQGMFIVAVLLPILPGIHPRMVSDFRGPEPTRLLEPPGFFVTNYGAHHAAGVDRRARVVWRDDRGVLQPVFLSAAGSSGGRSKDPAANPAQRSAGVLAGWRGVRCRHVYAMQVGSAKRHRTQALDASSTGEDASAPIPRPFRVIN